MNSDISQSLGIFCENYKELNYKKGDIVIRGDDEPTGVYLIKSGSVKMSSINEEGEELAVNIFKPETFFPMTWAIGGLKNVYYYQTLSQCTLVRIPKEDFLDFLKNNPSVLFDLTRRILIGLDGVLFNMKRLLRGDSIAKISVIILSLARRFGVLENGLTEIRLGLTHQDLSHFAGLTRETTTLAIKKLVEDEIIVQKQRRLYVRDMNLLENRSRGLS